MHVQKTTAKTTASERDKRTCLTENCLPWRLALHGTENLCCRDPGHYTDTETFKEMDVKSAQSGHGAEEPLFAYFLGYRLSYGQGGIRRGAGPNTTFHMKKEQHSLSWREYCWRGEGRYRRWAGAVLGHTNAVLRSCSGNAAWSSPVLRIHEW